MDLVVRLSHCDFSHDTAVNLGLFDLNIRF